MMGDCISDNEGINARGPLHPSRFPPKGPSTYLHAGASKIGWPYDHSVEDTYEVPPYIWHAHDDNVTYPTLSEAVVSILKDDAAIDATALNDAQAATAFLQSQVFTPEAIAANANPKLLTIDEEYVAFFGAKGEALLAKRKRVVSDTVIASFETFADAQTAAEALNHHEGY